MTGAPDPRDGDPATDAPPDLAADDPGWDAPLADLAGPVGATPGARTGGDGTPEPRDVIGPDAGGVRSDDAPPALREDDVLPDLGGPDPDVAGSDAGLPDLSPGDVGGPDHVGSDLVPDLMGSDDWAPTPAASSPARGERRRARRRRGAPDDAAADGHAAPPAGRTTGGTVDGADRAGPARGLAVGGPVGGLEPGTLFSNVDADAPTDGRRRRRARRGGRRGRASAGGAGEAGTSSADDTGDEDAPGGVTASDRPLTAEERLQHALKLAYRHLTKRDRTVAEVRTHLERREVDEASIVGALAELREFGYLDDERYAARFVEDKRRLEGWGRLRIEQGLRRTGVDREIADRVLADDPLRNDEAELAVDALEHRLAGRAPADDRARQKALRHLATRGYPLEVAYAAVRTYERRCAERLDR